MTPPLTHRYFHPIGLLLLLSCLVSCIRGYSQPANPNTVTVEFTVLTFSSDQLPELYYFANSAQPATTPLKFRKYARSRIYAYTGSPELILYRRSKAITDTPEDEPIASCTLPHSGRFLLILNPINPCTITLIDDSPAAFPIGTVNFYNTTGYPIEASLGASTITLFPGSSGPFILSQSDGQDIPVTLTITHAGIRHKVLQNTWRFYPDNRTIFLLLPPKDPNSLRIQAVRISDYSSPRGDKSR